ncbi:MAG: hypothetical protein J5685_08045 [Clostridiales bacterium]|nr:hypothetical protein [Clostridiales bacterium]
MSKKKIFLRILFFALIAVVSSVILLRLFYPRVSRDFGELQTVTISYGSGEDIHERVIEDGSVKKEIYDAIRSSRITSLNLLDAGDAGGGSDGISICLRYSDGTSDHYLRSETGNTYTRYIYSNGSAYPTGVMGIDGSLISSAISGYN